MAIELNDSNFKTEVLEDKLPVLVDFFAPWCAPCGMMAPVLEELAKDYEGKLKVCKLNVDVGPASASKYGVMSIPTLVVFKDGKEVDRAIGAVDKSRLEAMIKPYI